MPPSGFTTVSVDDETAAELDRIADAEDYESRAAAVRAVVDAYDGGAE